MPYTGEPMQSRYPVQHMDEVVRTITTFDEPSAKGGPFNLVQHTDGVPDEVFSVSVEDKALLGDFSTHDLADMRSCDFTAAQVTYLVGVGVCLARSCLSDQWALWSWW